MGPINSGTCPPLHGEAEEEMVVVHRLRAQESVRIQCEGYSGSGSARR